MQETIEQIFRESVAVKEETLVQNVEAIEAAVKTIVRALKKGNKLFICGNGGSAADSQHIAAEFIGRFQKERRSFPAIALTTDTSALTALGNDYSFDIVFARQLEGLGKKGDVLLALSTSGNAANVLAAVKKARSLGITTIALTGHKGGKLAPLSDIKMIVPSDVTARIQETHILIAHCICELAENKLVAK